MYRITVNQFGYYSVLESDNPTFQPNVVVNKATKVFCEAVKEMRLNAKGKDMCDAISRHGAVGVNSRTLY